jgi:hypothetical protein
MGRVDRRRLCCQPSRRYFVFRLCQGSIDTREKRLPFSIFGVARFSRPPITLVRSEKIRSSNSKGLRCQAAPNGAFEPQSVFLAVSNIGGVP